MQPHARDREREVKGRRFRAEPYIPKQIGDGSRFDHRRISQRQIADRTHSLLELAGDTSALAGVITVVRTRSKFVHQQLAVFKDEHLDDKQSNDLKLLCDLQSEITRDFVQLV